MSIPTHYLNQGIQGNLGKYQFDAKSLEILGFLKAGTFDKAKSNSEAINFAANWTGINGINSAADFLTNPAIQENSIEKMFEKNYELLTKTIPGFSKLTDNEQAGLLQVAQMSGIDGVKTLFDNVNGKLSNISRISIVITELEINSSDVAIQPSPARIAGIIFTKFSTTQIQALAAQTAKITSKLPVSIPSILQKFVSQADTLGGTLDRLPGLDKLPGGVQSLTNSTGGLNKTLGGIAGAASKLPGGLSNVPGNLSSVAGQLPPSVTNKVGGLAGGLNKISQITSKLPGSLNDAAGVVPSKLTQLASTASKVPSLIDQYKAGFNASELGKKLAKV